MTSAVLYGTTSDNILKPVRVTDSGEFVTDGGGSSDWYANLYVGGTEGNPSISLLSDGDITTAGHIVIPDDGYRSSRGIKLYNTGIVQAVGSGASNVFMGFNAAEGATAPATFYVLADGSITAAGDVYAKAFIDTDGYDLSKIGQALSTIHDVLDSVDDFQGLKNLLHHLLDNLKSDPTPPTTSGPTSELPE